MQIENLKQFLGKQCPNFSHFPLKQQETKDAEA